jgi:hypothetical protein
MVQPSTFQSYCQPRLHDQIPTTLFRRKTDSSEQLPAPPYCVIARPLRRATPLGLVQNVNYARLTVRAAKERISLTKRREFIISSRHIN